MSEEMFTEEEMEQREEELSPREKAELKMKHWAECVDLDTERQLFEDLVEELVYVVQKERLNFDEETEVFKYILLKPVNGKKIVEIKETDFEEKKSLQKFKGNERMDRAGMLLSKHTNLTTADVHKLKTRDQNRITAVVLGFLSQSTLTMT